MPTPDNLSPDAAEAVKRLREQEARDFRAYLDTPQTCELLGAGPTTVRELMVNNTLKSIKSGGRRRVLKSSAYDLAVAMAIESIDLPVKGERRGPPAVSRRSVG
jgi:excisionase family DNA binding protein